MNSTDLSVACPGVDFTLAYKPYDTSFTIGDYVMKYLQETFEIIKSSSTMENNTIVDFVRAGIKDHHLPYTQSQLIENLKCSAMEADDFLLAQSSFFAVTFNPLEFKTLGPCDSVPFVADYQSKIRTGGYGMVEKVFEGNGIFARKTIRDNYDTEKIMMELKILRLATETENPHLLRLRCAYEQENQMCLVTYPWCEFDLRTFLEGSSEMAFWSKLQPKDKLILITDWMACLASGLSALHKKKIKHQDLKPENVLLCLLGDRMMPVICDFGLSKAFAKDSKSVKVQGTREYFPPEQFIGKVGRKGDVFSLGLIFVELGLLLFGQKSLKHQISSGFYMDISTNLDAFLTLRFPCSGVPFFLDWCTSFYKLLKAMLDETPSNRPKASGVWEDLKEMVESLGAKPHCEYVSPVKSIPDVEDETEDTEIMVRENIASMFAE
jgi:serine/threonine protein kinase